MASSGCGVGEAFTVEDTQVVIVLHLPEEQDDGCSVASRGARPHVKQVTGSLESVRLERGWHGGVKKHGAHTIVQDA